MLENVIDSLKEIIGSGIDIISTIIGCLANTVGNGILLTMFALGVVILIYKAIK